MTTPRLPRDDVAAAMAARRELGPDYDDAFAETVVARLQEAMDTRAAPSPNRQPQRQSEGVGNNNYALTTVIVSLLASIPLTAIGAVNAGLPGLLIVWIGLVLINAVHAMRPR